MAKLLVINADSAARKPQGVQEIGDIVGEFHDDHQFSPTEQVRFDILSVWGTVDEVRKSLPRVETRERDDGHEWKNPDDGKWYKLKKRKKFEVNVSSLSVQDKAALASSLTSKEDREAAYSHMTNKIKEDPINISVTSFG